MLPRCTTFTFNTYTEIYLATVAKKAAARMRMLFKTKGEGKIREITSEQAKLTVVADSGSVHANVEQRG
jgi:hypothetical protein